MDKTNGKIKYFGESILVSILASVLLIKLHVLAFIFPTFVTDSGD